MAKKTIILLVCIVPILASCQPSPAVLSIHANPGDPAIEAIVDHVSSEQYQIYHLAVENMGLGLYCGKEYDMGYRNRDFYIYDDSISDEGPTYDDGPTPGNREACLYLQDMYGAMGLRKPKKKSAPPKAKRIAALQKKRAKIESELVTVLEELVRLGEEI